MIRPMIVTSGRNITYKATMPQGTFRTLFSRVTLDGSYGFSGIDYSFILF